MLTQQDLKAIGALIDKKVATDIAAIQGRLADLESGRITKIDFLEPKVTLGRVENRATAIEGRMGKFDGRMDTIEKRLDQTLTKADAKNFATKRSLKMMENRLIKSINEAVDSFDDKIIDHEKRIKNLETNFRLS